MEETKQNQERGNSVRQGEGREERERDAVILVAGTARSVAAEPVTVSLSSSTPAEERYDGERERARGREASPFPEAAPSSLSMVTHEPRVRARVEGGTVVAAVSPNGAAITAVNRDPEREEMRAMAGGEKTPYLEAAVVLSAPPSSLPQGQPLSSAVCVAGAASAGAVAIRKGFKPPQVSLLEKWLWLPEPHQSFWPFLPLETPLPSPENASAAVEIQCRHRDWNLLPLPLEVAAGLPSSRFGDRCCVGSAVPPLVRLLRKWLGTEVLAVGISIVDLGLRRKGFCDAFGLWNCVLR
ncbi:uncharacterized protein DS421_20g691990 [Arachis hypogaea]|nr:uncharacterized protein DS421_20g691990 [Arachis hypogaea]